MYQGVDERDKWNVVGEFGFVGHNKTICVDLSAPQIEQEKDYDKEPDEFNVTTPQEPLEPTPYINNNKKTPPVNINKPEKKEERRTFVVTRFDNNNTGEPVQDGAIIRYSDGSIGLDPDVLEEWKEQYSTMPERPNESIIELYLKIDDSMPTKNKEWDSNTNGYYYGKEDSSHPTITENMNYFWTDGNSITLPPSFEKWESNTNGYYYGKEDSSYPTITENMNYFWTDGNSITIPPLFDMNAGITNIYETQNPNIAPEFKEDTTISCSNSYYREYLNDKDGYYNECNPKPKPIIEEKTQVPINTEQPNTQGLTTLHIPTNSKVTIGDGGYIFDFNEDNQKWNVLANTYSDDTDNSLDISSQTIHLEKGTYFFGGNIHESSIEITPTNDEDNSEDTCELNLQKGWNAITIPEECRSISREDLGLAAEDNSKITEKHVVAWEIKVGVKNSRLMAPKIYDEEIRETNLEKMEELESGDPYWVFVNENTNISW
jgi:hypothetical protein